jgi:hypothetical protein
MTRTKKPKRTSGDTLNPGTLANDFNSAIGYLTPREAHLEHRNVWIAA